MHLSADLVTLNLVFVLIFLLYWRRERNVALAKLKKKENQLAAIKKESDKSLGPTPEWTEKDLKNIRTDLQNRWGVLNSDGAYPRQFSNQRQLPPFKNSQNKNYQYSHSDHRTRYCSSCGKEIYPLTTYVVEQYESEKWEDLVYSEKESVFCSWSCTQNSWSTDDGCDENYPGCDDEYPGNNSNGGRWK